MRIQITLALAIVFVGFIKAQKTESVSLNGEWKLCYGIYD